MSTTICKIMKNVLILLCLAVMTACAQRNEPTTQANRIPVDELDSMITCVEEFDFYFSLDDTVLEDEDGEFAYFAWDGYLHNTDTLDVEVLRELYRPLAAQLMFVLNCQLEYDPDNYPAVQFNRKWRSFLLRYCAVAHCEH